MIKASDNMTFTGKALGFAQKLIMLFVIALLAAYIVPSTINNLYLNPKPNYWFIIDLFDIYVAWVMELLLLLSYLFCGLLKKQLSKELGLHAVKNNCGVSI